jgi:hypothetical protein
VFVFVGTVVAVSVVPDKADLIVGLATAIITASPLYGSRRDRKPDGRG